MCFTSTAHIFFWNQERNFIVICWLCKTSASIVLSDCQANVFDACKTHKTAAISSVFSLPNFLCSLLGWQQQQWNAENAQFRKFSSLRKQICSRHYKYSNVVHRVLEAFMCKKKCGHIVAVNVRHPTLYNNWSNWLPFARDIAHIINSVSLLFPHTWSWIRIL